MVGTGWETIEQAVREAVREHGGIAAVAVFGSHARGTAWPDSDLHLAVLLQDDAEVDRQPLRSRLAADLAHLTADGAVDVVFFDEAPVVLRQRVLQKGQVVVCRDDEAWKRLRIETLREYEDTAWMRRFHVEAQRRHLLEDTDEEMGREQDV
jgi:predicted nucleotidyltransferase